MSGSFAAPQAATDLEAAEVGEPHVEDDQVRLVRQRQRAKSAEFLRQLIAEGIASGPATPQEPDFFDKMRQRARQRAEQGKQK